jgi:dTDP-4-dehydrorhamnose 3,5-epimerase-like enzyme
MTTPRYLPVRTHLDARGSLGVMEDGDLPFLIRRVYYLFDVPIGAVRGEHGHKTLEQLMICMNGRVEVTLNNGSGQFRFELSRPDQALHVPPGMWRSLRFVDPGTVVCVLASQPYDRQDYIFTFEDFLTWVSKKSNQR